MNKKKSLYLISKLVILFLVVFSLVAFRYDRIIAGAIPTTSIVDVEEDTKVILRTYDYPADQTFTITMGEFGTRGVGGIIVGTVNSGTGGSFLVEATIPAELYDLDMIAVRLESPLGYYSFDWFYNSDGNVPVEPSTSVPDGYTGYPTFSITDVEKDVDVSISGVNFPPSQNFVVTMGKMWTQGVGGYEVATTPSGDGGAITATYDIPAALHGDYQISIRMESSEGYYAYNWFYNNSTNGTTEPPSSEPYVYKIPTTSIVSVEPGVSVTIKTYDFPPDQIFKVTMGNFGTRGINGIVVGSTDSGVGGTFVVTYPIPAELVDNDLIAIRLESPEGFYAFDWFNNQ